MAYESAQLFAWFKAMARSQPLPLDSTEVHDSVAAAEEYAATGTAYAGQSIKAMGADGKYHEYILQPTDSGYVLEEVGAIKEEDLKQYVQVVSAKPESGQLEGVLYIVGTDGWIWTGSAWKKVFWDLTTDLNGVSGRVKTLEDNMENYAPINNPHFSGSIYIGANAEVATQSWVQLKLSEFVSDVPGVLYADTLLENNLVFHAGETYRVAEAGMYFGHSCEAGDLVIILDGFMMNTIENGDGSGGAEPTALDGNENNENNDNYNNVMVVQANIDGAVTSSADAVTDGEIVLFDGVTGKIIKRSNVTIASLNAAIAKAHEHSNKAKLDTYDKTQAELLAAAKSEAQGLVTAHENAVNTALNGYAKKATTLSGYGITDAYTKTEVDNKLSPITQNLNTKAASTDVQQWIATAKSETLTGAAQAAEEALEARVGAIPENTTVKAYIDTAVGSGGTASAQAIATAKQEAIAAANAYTDAALTVTVF